MKRFDGGIISRRSLTGHAHGNAFSFYRFLVRLRRVDTALIAMEHRSRQVWQLVQRVQNKRCVLLVCYTVSHNLPVKQVQNTRQVQRFSSKR